PAIVGDASQAGPSRVPSTSLAFAAARSADFRYRQRRIDTMLPRLVTLTAVPVLAGVIALMAAEAPQPDQRAAAAKQFQDGNWNDAYQAYRGLSLDDDNAGKPLAEDFTKAVQCLNNLQRQHEIDAFRDEVV